MSPPNGQIQGRAVFGTWHGLQACGNGILAGAQNMLGAFEFGQNRSHLHDQSEEGQRTAIFCRRVKEEARGSEIELVGVVAPCKDSQGRRGFLGACVATGVDSRQPHRFGDWKSLGEGISSAFVKVKENFARTKHGSFLRNCPMVPTGKDYKFNWVPTTSEVLLLHCDVDGENGWDPEVLEYMQAIAFKEGTHHPTILVFKTAVTRSQFLRANSYVDFLHRLREAKAEPLPQERVHSDLPESPNDNLGQDPMGHTPDWRTEIETRLKRLENRVDTLESKGQPFRTVAPPPPASLRTQETKSFLTLKVIVVVVSVTVLLVGSILLGIYWPFGQSAP